MTDVTKIQRVLAAIGESTSVEEIERATGFSPSLIRNYLLVLRERKQVRRLNEGRANVIALFTVTPAGIDALASVETVVVEAPVTTVQHAISRRPALATVWANA
jgi:DNA-binding IclR family transcriptional regulator